jgi:hypothetical protein
VAFEGGVSLMKAQVDMFSGGQGAGALSGEAFILSCVNGPCSMVRVFGQPSID